jgi:hypothetical protein
LAQASYRPPLAKIWPFFSHRTEAIHRYVGAKYMKKLLLLVLAAFTPALSGCDDGTVTRAYREGVSYYQLEQMLTSCQVYAAQQVPANIRTSTTPAYTTPVQTYCNNIGGFTSCNSTGGQTYGGDTYSTDVNSSLRAKVLNQCYAQNGIGYYTFSPCTPEAAADFKPSSNLPKLQQNTCTIALQGNLTAFHTPGI